MATLKPMTSMLFDIWVYVGIIGLIGSAVAFPMLLRRYREAAANEAGVEVDPLDGVEELDPVAVVEEEGSDSPVETVVTAEEPAKEEPVVEKKEEDISPPTKEEHPLKKAAREDAAGIPQSLKTGQTTAGGISPAVVYLQNLKMQMEHFEQEIHSLRSQVVNFAHKHDQEFDILLKKMTEFQSELHHEMETVPAEKKKASAPVAKPTPTPAPVVKPAPTPAPVAKPAPTPAPVAKPAPTPAPVAKPAPTPAPAAKPAPTPAPVVKPAPKPEPKPEPKPAPVAKPEPKPEPKPELKPAPVAKPEVKPEPKPAPEPDPISVEPTIELSPTPEKPPAAAASEPQIELSVEPVKKEGSPQDIADSLSLSAPEKGDKAAGEDTDPLQPDTSKGPVWPV